MQNKRILPLLVAMACTVLTARAQQLPQLTQYQFNDYVFNPAVAGTRQFFELRSGHRYQWVGIQDAPRTFTLSGITKWPGSVNLPGPVFSAVNEAVVDSMVVNGFKRIVLMGDHGGGQTELKELAERLDTKYAAKGSRVYFCGDVYAKTHDDVDAWVKEHGLPLATHGGIHDTSLLMFLGGDVFVRRDKLVAGDPVIAPGQQLDPTKPRVDNGVTGDPRPSTPEIGKVFFDFQVRNAVAQIRSLIAAGPSAAR